MITTVSIPDKLYDKIKEKGLKLSELIRYGYLYLTEVKAMRDDVIELANQVRLLNTQLDAFRQAIRRRLQLLEERLITELRGVGCGSERNNKADD